MKTILVAVAAALALAAPALSFGQSQSGLTRSEVKADLVRLEKAGYNPARTAPDYAATIQAAEARVAAQSAAPHENLAWRQPEAAAQDASLYRRR